jgi:hypothetical protein
MGRRHAKAIVIYRGRLSVVIPARGGAYYVRADGAVGRRKGDTMFWVTTVEDDLEVLASEIVSHDVLALDRTVTELAALIAQFRAGV